MYVVRVEGRIDLVEVTVDEPLGPCHDGLGLGVLLVLSRHGLEREGVAGKKGCRSPVLVDPQFLNMKNTFSDILGGVRGTI